MGKRIRNGKRQAISKLVEKSKRKSVKLGLDIVGVFNCDTITQTSFKISSSCRSSLRMGHLDKISNRKAKRKKLNPDEIMGREEKSKQDFKLHKLW